MHNQLHLSLLSFALEGSRSLEQILHLFKALEQTVKISGQRVDSRYNSKQPAASLQAVLAQAA